MLLVGFQDDLLSNGDPSAFNPGGVGGVLTIAGACSLLAGVEGPLRPICDARDDGAPLSGTGVLWRFDVEGRGGSTTIGMVVGISEGIDDACTLPCELARLGDAVRAGDCEFASDWELMCVACTTGEEVVR